MKKVILLFIGLIALFLIFNLFFFDTKEKEQILQYDIKEKKEAVVISKADEYGLDKLSTDQKIGQLFMIGFNGKTVTPEIEEIVKKIHPGAVLLLKRNIGTDEELKKMISTLQNLVKNDTGLPLFIAVDQEGSDLNRIEDKKDLGQSEIDSEKMAKELGIRRAEKLKSFGINLNLAPLLDICGEKDFIYYRTFKKDFKTIGSYAKELINGQKEGGIFSCIKHFPGYANISFNPEEDLASVEDLPTFSQFNIAGEANPEIIMISNVVYNNIDKETPLTFSEKGLNFLKKQLGDKYIILSDDLDQNAMLKKYELEDIVSKPVSAGVDMIIFSGWRKPSIDGFEAFKKAVSSKKITEERLNEAVSKILKFKNDNLSRF